MINELSYVIVIWLFILFVSQVEGALSMVEGHSVHRVAALHRTRLIGKSFHAVSPNGRFKEGASAINGKIFTRIEAVGKNLFAFFGDDGNNCNNDNDNDVVVVHVHFGMAGNWAVYDTTKDDEDIPDPSKTNRLRLTGHGLVADLSAMTVQHGDLNLYTSKRSKLGEDPLRNDADPNRLWERVSKSNKSIGALIMDQSYFTGPGNIYRAEILFKSGVHPDVPGKELQRNEFEKVWKHTVLLLKRGFDTGSILTVDPEEAQALGMPKLRRYIYNSAKCPRCSSSIRTWDIANRKCYACPKCQPLIKKERAPTVAVAAAVVTPEKKQRKICVPFNSHCAPESVMERLQTSGPTRLTVEEIKRELVNLGEPVPVAARKPMLVELLQTALETKKKPAFISPEDAATEKALAGESLAVEHIAELAPMQARVARSRAKQKGSSIGTPKRVSESPREGNEKRRAPPGVNKRATKGRR